MTLGSRVEIKKLPKEERKRKPKRFKIIKNVFGENKVIARVGGALQRVGLEEPKIPREGSRRQNIIL